MVRSEDVGQSNEIHALRRRCGKKDPLKRNGYFERRPHYFQSAWYQNESTSSASNAVQKEHERDRTVSYPARHIFVGSDGVCLHRDLFDYPLFDRGVKPAVTLPAKRRHRVR